MVLSSFPFGPPSPPCRSCPPCHSCPPYPSCRTCPPCPPCRTCPCFYLCPPALRIHLSTMSFLPSMNSMSSLSSLSPCPYPKFSPSALPVFLLPLFQPLSFFLSCPPLHYSMSLNSIVSYCFPCPLLQYVLLVLFPHPPFPCLVRNHLIFWLTLIWFQILA